MNLYYLTPKGNNPVCFVSNPTGGSSMVLALPHPPYIARRRAFEHAHAQGAEFCGIINGALIPVRADGVRTDHALMLYVCRLLREVCAAVVLRPINPEARARGWEEHEEHPEDCAFYRTDAVVVDGVGSLTPACDVARDGRMILTPRDFGYRAAYPGAAMFPVDEGGGGWGDLYLGAQLRAIEGL